MSRSEELYERALQVLPGGVSRNTVLRTPQPYAAYGEGCELVDLEGVSRTDFSNNMASLLHGHADPDIVASVTAQLQRGTAFTMATEIEVEFAEHLCSRNDSFDKVRFVNSGTEAIMACLKASRAFTGKPKIAKVEGAYHGQYDYAEVSQTPSPENWGDLDAPNSVPVAHGTPESALNDVIIIPFNDIDRAITRLDAHKDDIACVLIDLMPHRVGLRPADANFVEAIRSWTSKHGALLVFDEVITFRSEFGGLQERYSIAPDLTALGKAIGGGFPVGALAGRKDVMDVMNPNNTPLLFPHSGTFSANPVTLTAGLTAMKKFDRDTIAHLNALTTKAVKGIESAIAETAATACVTGAGSMFRIHFKETSPVHFREAFTSDEENRKTKVMLDHLFDAGFVMINTWSGALSTPMSETEVDGLVSAIRSGLKSQ